MADENKDKDAAAVKERSKPDQPGTRDGEEKDGYVWSKADNDWRDNQSTDFAADPAALPYGFEKVGDGSPEKPHQVRQANRWT